MAACNRPELRELSLETGWASIEFEVLVRLDVIHYRVVIAVALLKLFGVGPAASKDHQVSLEATAGVAESAGEIGQFHVIFQYLPGKLDGVK